MEQANPPSPRAPAVTVAVFCTVVSWLSAPRRIQPGDAGEIATVMLRGGVPHPPGYPWLRILGWAARGLETVGLPPALAAALPCALLGVIAFTLLQRTFERHVDPWASALVLGLVAASPLFVRHVYDSEVWGPFLASASLFIWACLGRDEPPRPVWLGLSLGLCATCHLTAILLIPLAVAAAWPRSNHVRDIVMAGLEGVAGSALGLLAFATLAVGAGGAWRWGDTRSTAGLIRHVSRADYGVTALSLHPERPSLAALWGRAATSVADVHTVGLASAWPIFAFVLMVGVAVWAVRRPPPTLSTRLLSGWWGCVVTSTLGFPALQNIAPDNLFGAWILERFDLLTVLLWALPVAWALTELRNILEQRSTRLAPLLTAVAIALLASQGARAWPERPALDEGVEAYATDVLESPPAGAIVFGTDDHRTFPILFAHEVLGAGPDTVYVDASLLGHEWYRRRLAAARPDIPWQALPLATLDQIWARPELRQTPIYVANVFSRPVSELRLVPEGVLWRVLPPAQLAAPPPVDTVLDRYVRALSRTRAHPSQFAGRDDPTGHPFSGDLWANYVQLHVAMQRELVRAERPDLLPALDASWRDSGLGPATSGP